MLPHVKKLVILVFFSTALVGCSKTPTHTADWYVKHAQARKAEIKKCSNNPGQLKNTPNCQNVNAAIRKMSAGGFHKLKW